MANADVVKPITWYREKRATPARIARQFTAAEAIGSISQDQGFTILTNGAFSMIDAIRHCLSCIGPAHVLVTTWVPGCQELVDLHDLKQEGIVKSLRIIIDYGFAATKPERVALMCDLFGIGQIVESRIHAKIATIVNDDWHFVIRGSLNLNGNFRLENLDGDDSPEFCTIMDEVFDGCSKMLPGRIGQRSEAVSDAFRAMFSNGDSPPRKESNLTTPIW